MARKCCGCAGPGSKRRRPGSAVATRSRTEPGLLGRLASHEDVHKYHQQRDPLGASRTANEGRSGTDRVAAAPSSRPGVSLFVAAGYEIARPDAGVLHCRRPADAAGSRTHDPMSAAIGCGRLEGRSRAALVARAVTVCVMPVASSRLRVRWPRADRCARGERLRPTLKWPSRGSPPADAGPAWAGAHLRWPGLPLAAACRGSSAQRGVLRSR